MPFLTPEQAAAVLSSTVRAATLVEMQFASATTRIWNGAGAVTVAGVGWDGIGAMGSIDGLQQSREPTSSKVTLRLSGATPEMLATAKGTVDDVRGRHCYIWDQLFNDEWQPIGARIPLFWGVMQRINIVRDEATEFSGGSRVCELEVENPFAARARPSAGRFTDADQQSRHPGDRFFRFIPSQRSQVVVWPDY